MSIQLINAVFITLLFAFWVWTLKQEIESLRHGAPSASGHDSDPHSEAAVPAAPKPPRHVIRPGSPAAHGHKYDMAVKSRNREGVATWTIA
jgi:hypothetical protein